MDELVCQAEIKIKNAEGLHMRPAMQLVDVATRYKSKITIIKNGFEVDGKSIMQVSMLAATYGTTLVVRSQGPDARQAIDAIRELVEVKLFGEPPPSPQDLQKE